MRKKKEASDKVNKHTETFYIAPKSTMFPGHIRPGAQSGADQKNKLN